MNRIYLIIFVLSLYCFAGCESIITEYDTTADYNKYRAFSVIEEENDGIDNEFIKYQLISAVEQKLQSMGYIKTGADKSDYHVGLKVRMRKETQSATPENRYLNIIDRHGSGYDSVWNFSDERLNITESITYQTENLYIKVYDAKTKKLLWRGYSQTGIADDMSMERKAVTICDTAGVILDNFPKRK